MVGSEGEMSGFFSLWILHLRYGTGGRECCFLCFGERIKKPWRILRLIFGRDLYPLVVGRVIEIPVLAKRV